MSGPVIRPVAHSESEAALILWEQVFPAGRDYFGRYVNADPWHREGDCLGAFVDGQLVSAVHLCRRPLRWDGRTVWCGAIANVATLPDHRRRGLSRRLLEAAIRRMEETGIDFSMLFTGSHRHYAVLGWERVVTPAPGVDLLERSPRPGRGAAPEPAGLETCVALYGSLPAHPLLLERPAGYFRDWAAWNWARWEARPLVLPAAGYAVLQAPEPSDSVLRVLEWRARDEAVEAELLRIAATEARRVGAPRLRLAAVPRGGLAVLAALGDVAPESRGAMMLRNVRLTPGEYGEVIRLYTSGEAVWWRADGF